MTASARRLPGLPLLLLLLLLGGVAGLTLAGEAPLATGDVSLAGATNSSLAHIPAVDVETDPNRLNRPVRVLLDTNAPANPAEQRTKWVFDWQDWDGLYLELERKTWLPALSVPGLTNAPKLRLDDVRMAARVGGVFDFDAAGFANAGDYTGFEPGFQLRRARLTLKGDCLLLTPTSYDFELGYVPNQFSVQKAYVVFPDLPYVGNLQVGSFTAPMGLEQLTSSRDIRFMEMAAPVYALTPGVNTGLQLSHPAFQQRMTWAIGLFTVGANDDSGQVLSSYGRVIGRVSGLPVYEFDPAHPETQHLLHLGLSANFVYTKSESIQYRAKPESDQAPYVLDTGSLTANASTVTGLEALWIRGPVSVQGEYLHAAVSRVDLGDVGFNGAYVAGGWFLTGESRPYDTKRGYPGRVIPRQNFAFRGPGWGAFEVSGRVSWLNLDDGNVRGGELTLFMAGLTWVLQPHLQWRFNYGVGRVTGRQPDGCMNIFQTRLHVDF